MRQIRGIEKNCLNLIQESSRSIHPREFAGLLSVGESRDIISEVVLVPGTISGASHAIYRLFMAPVDYSIVGTVHSHPTSNAMPSEADRHFFQKYGIVHIIMAEPYDDFSWKAFDFKGKNGTPYRYLGEKVNIKPWNLHRTHTTCYGTITDLNSSKDISKSILYFRFRTIPAFLKSFRLA